MSYELLVTDSDVVDMKGWEGGGGGRVGLC